MHHHHTPPAYLLAVLARGIVGPMRRWTPSKSIEDMDKGGVATAVTSITAPALRFLSARWARRVARACNDYSAKLVSDRRGRFGMFAVMPMPDIDGTLAEIAYALDTLKADGIGLLTNYGDRWLGDPAFAPVMEELNRRKAVVYTHPASVTCCTNLIPDVPEAVIELATDTSRAIASLVFSGTAARYPDMRIIFSHGGGTMPFLVERFIRLPVIKPRLAARVPHGVEHELRRFYYDTAQASHPAALASLLTVAPSSQVLFGSDFPYRTAAEHAEALSGRGFPLADLLAIERDNALRLMPGLLGSPGISP